MPKKSNNSQTATKSDIQRLEKSTKSNIQRLESDIKRFEKSTKLDIKGLKHDFKSFEERLGAKIDKIANTLDGFVGRVDDLTIENKVGVNQARELRVQIDDHEERITKIETTVIQ